MDNIAIKKEIRTAFKSGDSDRIKELIGTNDDILNMSTAFGTWLHVAADFGNLEMVKHLVNSGVDVNTIGGICDAGAIERAASNGYIEIVKYLLDSGAELDVSEPDRNPLFAAIYGGHKDIVALLIAHGIDATIKYTGKYMKNMDAYAFAIERGQLEISDFIKSNTTIKEDGSI